MWKDETVATAYKVMRGLGWSHESLRPILHSRIRHGQWEQIVRATRDLRAFEPNPNGPRVVVWSMVGDMPLTNLEIPLAIALQARGARVELALCDGRQRHHCNQLTVETLERRTKTEVCSSCVAGAQRILRQAPFIKVRLSSELVSDDRSRELLARAESLADGNLLEIEEEGIRIGLPALMTSLRHWRRGTFKGTPEERAVNVDMLHSSLLALEGFRRLHEEGPIWSAVFSHGIYDMWGPVADYCLRHGIHYSTYDVGDRKDSYIFAANASSRLADISEPFRARWRQRPLTTEQRNRATDYFLSRSNFSQDLLKQTYGNEYDRDEVLRRLDLRPDVPVFTLFGNVAWDAAAVGRDLVFSDIFSWILKTIDFVGQRPDKAQLIIKPHPAEALRGTRQALLEEVQRAYPVLPPNVRLLSPKVDINAHSIMRVTDVGLVHTSTVGLEMSILGIPTVVVSWTHYRGLGFTFDPQGVDEYFEMLSEPGALKGRMSEETRELALKYFYVRAFHSWIDLPLVCFDANRVGYGWQIASLDDLLPGRMPNLDFICDGILSHRQDYLLEESG